MPVKLLATTTSCGKIPCYEGRKFIHVLLKHSLQSRRVEIPTSRNLIDDGDQIGETFTTLVR